ncbi:hypothetical protein THIOSC15_590002 [uncultured Thiomicrorhabdus sp.]
MTVVELFEFLQAQYGQSWQAVVESHGGYDAALADWQGLDVQGLTFHSKPFYKLRDTHPVTRGAPSLDEFAALLRGDWAAPLGIPKYDDFIRIVRGEKAIPERLYKVFYFDLLRAIRAKTGNGAVDWIRSRTNPNSIRSVVQPIYQAKREEYVRKPWQVYQQAVSASVSKPVALTEQDKQVGKQVLDSLKQKFTHKNTNEVA